MRKIFLLLALSLYFSCSSDDNGGGEIPTPMVFKQFINKTINTTSNGSTEIDFIYDSNNNLIKTDTDSYFRDFVYSNNRITQIKSITKPNTPYYTVNFVYDNSGNLIEVKRDNHHNSTIYYTTYTYTNNRVTKVCTYNSLNDYNQGNCERNYTIEYTDNTRNFTAKVLSLDTSAGVTILEPAGFTYDTRNRPYFGDAIENIRIPYATDGTGMDWEIIYGTNNPTSKIIVTDLTTGASALRRSYEYQYNSENRPTQMVVKTFDINSGNQTSTFTQEYSYELR